MDYIKKGLDQAYKSDKVVKDKKGVTPVLGINNASCGKKLLRT